MIQAQENAEGRLETEVSAEYEIKIDPAGFVGHALAFEPYLFNRPEHLLTQHRQNPVSIALWQPQRKQLAAFLHLDHNGTEALSLPRSPSGGIQGTNGLSPLDYDNLLQAVESWCAENHLPRLVVKTPPAAYNEEQAALLHAAYCSRQFGVRQRYTNHHICITPAPFGDRLHPSERRRLRKCLRAGLSASIWHNPDPAQVYSFLAESRLRQGYALSLDFEQLRVLLNELPQHAQVFVVKDNQVIVSLTVGIRVSSRILYNFCPADNLDYRVYSPMVLLNSFLYEYAQNQGIELIDLGISLDHLGNEKPSLVRFKENLGAEKSEKITYEKWFR